MQTNPFAIRIEYVEVDGRAIATDQEGYIQDMEQWSEGFAEAQAAKEGLVLTEEHWQVIRYIRDYYERKGVQAQVRDMIRHFRKLWGPERGSNRYLHDLFPRGGPQKQGNRVAGIRKTKGEH
jgi:tRNA 2-thiouridine synthesizing protein E